LPITLLSNFSIIPDPGKKEALERLYNRLAHKKIKPDRIGFFDVNFSGNL